jgi:hypothetical protein
MIRKFVSARAFPEEDRADLTFAIVAEPRYLRQLLP